MDVRRGIAPRPSLRSSVLDQEDWQALGLQRPNLRLKLAGAHKQGSVALPRRPASLSAAPLPCARQHCARSLSAIR